MEIIHFIFIIMFILAPFVITENKINFIINDFKNPLHVFLFILLILFLYYIFNYKKDNYRLINAAKRALISFIIAYLAFLQLPYETFMLVFIIVYYLDDQLILRDN